MSQPAHTKGELTSDERYLRLPDGGIFAKVEYQNADRGSAFYIPESTADAARLALCWNTHDQLVDALEAIEQRMFEAGILDNSPGRTIKAIINDALAKCGKGRE
jgi:hypothetical protein